MRFLIRAARAARPSAALSPVASPPRLEPRLPRPARLGVPLASPLHIRARQRTRFGWQQPRADAIAGVVLSLTFAWSSPYAQPAEVLAATRSGASTSRNRRRVRGGLPMFDRSGRRVDVTRIGVI